MKNQWSDNTALEYIARYNAMDVAQAFLIQALALKSTANVTTVDGGNIEAILR
ncbi:MAG: hypothetical protein ACR2P1_12235 [Pseudomonadales bacterium]